MRAEVALSGRLIGMEWGEGMVGECEEARLGKGGGVGLSLRQYAGRRVKLR